MKEFLEERAAIKEYSGNMTRAEAERHAKAESKGCLTCKHMRNSLDDVPCVACTTKMTRWEKK